VIEQSIYSVLSGTAAITTIVGSNIFPLVLPTDPTLPAITYSTVASVSNPTMTTRGLTRARFQIDCWTEGDSAYLDGCTLRDAVIQTFAGHQDANFTSQILTTRDEFDHELLQYRAVVEIYVWYAQ
jgi:hypothetical protein